MFTQAVPNVFLELHSHLTVTGVTGVEYNEGLDDFASFGVGFSYHCAFCHSLVLE
jgi:hypothetical protein